MLCGPSAPVWSIWGGGWPPGDQRGTGQSSWKAPKKAPSPQNWHNFALNPPNPHFDSPREKMNIPNWPAQIDILEGVNNLIFSPERVGTWTYFYRNFRGFWILANSTEFYKIGQFLHQTYKLRLKVSLINKIKVSFLYNFTNFVGVIFESVLPVLWQNNLRLRGNTPEHWSQLTCGKMHYSFPDKFWCFKCS